MLLLIKYLVRLNMKNLYKYITEATIYNIQKAKEEEGLHLDLRGRVGWFKTAESCINKLNNSQKKHYFGTRMSIDEIDEMINKIYSLAGDKEFKWIDAPLAFSKTDVSIRRKYPEVLDEITTLYPKAKKMKLHNGFGNSASGLDFEDQVRDAIIGFINSAVQIYSGDKKATKDEVISQVISDMDKESILQNTPSKNIKYVFDLFKAGILDNLILKIQKEPEINLLDYVELSGRKDTQRNKNGQIFNDDFVIGKWSDEFAKESGEIIADITITSGTKHYISVKMKDSQHSSINFNALEAYLKTGKKSYEKAVQNFCKVFGVDFENLIKAVQDGEQLQFNKDGYQKDTLQLLIKKIIGGNYWYLKPNKCVFVDGIDGDLELTNITNTQRTINFIGKYNNQPIKIVFRTSDSGDIAPKRLFIEFDLNAIIASK